MQQGKISENLPMGFLNVNFVEQNTKKDKKNTQNFVIQTVKLKRIEQVESWQEQVYDIWADGEYFANGLLVHNCDAMRYATTALRKNRRNT